MRPPEGNPTPTVPLLIASSLWILLLLAFNIPDYRTFPI
jgi:hypothetical protein